MTIKVAGYCRVSTDKDDQANSFDSQQRYFREFIRNHTGWELYDIYADEGITGTSTKKRTQFHRMINDAYAGRFRLIITKEVSRFSRNVLDTIAYTRELRSIGVGVIFATDQINTLEPEGEMLLSFLASMAQEESRKTSTRVVWGQTRQMERGVVFGRSLLGYDVKGGKMTVNPQGAETIRLIFQKYAVEQVSTAEIARYLSREGYFTYRGNTNWNSNAVIKILHNEKYVGDLVQKKTYTPDYLTHEKRINHGAVPMIRIQDHHEPIISREVWNMAQERLQRNRKNPAGKNGHSNRYVFSGKIKCGECGNSFVGRFKYLKDGTKIRRWCCAAAVKDGVSGCDVGKLVRDDDAMQMLKTAIKILPLDTSAVIRNVATLALEAVLSDRPAIRKNPKQLQQELNRVQQKREVVMDSYFSGEITKEDMQTMLSKYDRQLTELRQCLEDAQMEEEKLPDPVVLRSNMEAEIKAIIDGETESEVFYKTMLESLTVFKDRHLELRLHLLAHVFWFYG